MKRPLQLAACAVPAILLAVRLFAAPAPPMQGKISGGFQAPSTVDDRGRRSVVKGTDATPQGNNIYLITEPRVTSYNPDDSPDMFINASKCTLDLKSNVAWSESDLSMRTADDRFALSGKGWQWDPQTSHLIISNSVTALVQKAVLAQGVTNRVVGGTNAPVRITARRFQQEGDSASFIGDVLVLDGQDTLRCARLNLQFERPGGVQRIEAIQDVELSQAGTQVRSGQAIYEMKNETLTITKNPVWNAKGREGSAEKLVLDRMADTLVAEGKVFMKLPLTNAVTATNAAASTNRPIEIYSDLFTFKNASSNRLAEAVYRGAVRVVHSEATIHCAELIAGFNREQQVQSLLAKGGVTIESAGRSASGDTAEYYLAEEKFALLGNPRWNMDDKSGSSDQVVFHPKSGEVLALGHVEMVLPTQSAAAMLPSFSQTTNAPAAAQSNMRITSGSFSHQRDISVFHESVKVEDARGTIDCQLLTLATGASNQLHRIVAETNVVITQKDMTASGDRADFNVRTGLVHLTGDPVLRGPDKSLRSEYFIIDRNANTFSVAPGSYRIELKLKKGQRIPQL